jgi:transposase-like protein
LKRPRYLGFPKWHCKRLLWTDPLKALVIGGFVRRNLQAKLPKSEHDRIRFNYWSALTDATSVKDGKLRLKVLIGELEHGGYESAARCLSDALDALVVHLRYPLRHRERWRSTNLLERSLGEVRRRTKLSPGCELLV